MIDAACSRCSSHISDGHGYAVYSGVEEGLTADRRVFFSAPGPDGVEKGDIERKPLDAMLYCEDCAGGLFTEKVWRNAKALRVEMPAADVHGAECLAARLEVIDFGIALRAKRLGMTPETARREAGAVRKMWWKDRDAAKRELFSLRELNGLRGWLIGWGLPWYWPRLSCSTILLLIYKLKPRIGTGHSMIWVTSLTPRIRQSRTWCISTSSQAQLSLRDLSISLSFSSRRKRPFRSTISFL